MRRVLIALTVLLFFTANQAAMAFESCKDAACISGTMDAKTKSEHQKKDPACASHCSMSSHHAAALPMAFDPASKREHRESQAWPGTTMLESATIEGLIEPPSLA